MTTMHTGPCDLLDDFVDDLMDSQQRNVFRDHLTFCGDCRKRIKSIPLTISGCQDIWNERQEGEASAGMLVGRIGKSNRHTSPGRRLMGIKVLGGFVAASLIAGLAIWYWTGFDRSTSGPVAEVETPKSPFAEFTSEQITELILREQQESRLRKSEELLNQMLNQASADTNAKELDY